MNERGRLWERVGVVPLTREFRKALAWTPACVYTSQAPALEWRNLRLFSRAVHPPDVWDYE